MQVLRYEKCNMQILFATFCTLYICECEREASINASHSSLLKNVSCLSPSLFQPPKRAKGKFCRPLFPLLLYHLTYLDG